MKKIVNKILRILIITLVHSLKVCLNILVCFWLIGWCIILFKNTILDIQVLLIMLGYSILAGIIWYYIFNRYNCKIIAKNICNTLEIS